MQYTFIDEQGEKVTIDARRLDDAWRALMNDYGYKNIAELREMGIRLFKAEM